MARRCARKRKAQLTATNSQRALQVVKDHPVFKLCGLNSENIRHNSVIRCCPCVFVGALTGIDLKDHQLKSATVSSTPSNRQPLHVAQLEAALLNVKTVMATTGFSRSTLHSKVKDGTFPAPIKLSARCVRWHSEAIRQWIDALATAK